MTTVSGQGSLDERSRPEESREARRPSTSRWRADAVRAVRNLDRGVRVTKAGTVTFTAAPRRSTGGKCLDGCGADVRGETRSATRSSGDRHDATFGPDMGHGASGNARDTGLEPAWLQRFGGMRPARFERATSASAGHTGGNNAGRRRGVKPLSSTGPGLFTSDTALLHRSVSRRLGHDWATGHTLLSSQKSCGDKARPRHGRTRGDGGPRRRTVRPPAARPARTDRRTRKAHLAPVRIDQARAQLRETDALLLALHDAIVRAAERRDSAGVAACHPPFSATMAVCRSCPASGSRGKTSLMNIKKTERPKTGAAHLWRCRRGNPVPIGPPCARTRTRHGPSFAGSHDADRSRGLRKPGVARPQPRRGTSTSCRPSRRSRRRRSSWSPPADWKGEDAPSVRSWGEARTS